MMRLSDVNLLEELEKPKFSELYKASRYIVIPRMPWHSNLLKKKAASSSFRRDDALDALSARSSKRSVERPAPFPRNEKRPSFRTAFAFGNGGLGRIRTCDLSVRSRMLYPLSHEPTRGEIPNSSAQGRQPFFSASKNFLFKSVRDSESSRRYGR